MKRLIVASTIACLLSVLPGAAHRNARAENLEVQGTLAVKNNADTYIWNARFTNDAEPTALYQYKSRGTSIDAHGLVLDWDCLGKNSFIGSGRNNVGTAAWLYGCVYRTMVDGTPNNGYMPTRFQIDTCPNTGTIVSPATTFSPVTRFTIKPDGKVGINTTAPNYQLEVAGDINAIGNVRSNTNILSSSRSFKRNITPVPASGTFSLAPDLVRGQRTGAWDVLDRLNVVDFEFKKCEQHWRMPDGRIVNS